MEANHFRLTLLMTGLGVMYIVYVAFSSGEVTLEGLLQEAVAFAGCEESYYGKAW